jgi:hypothetical protein
MNRELANFIRFENVAGVSPAQPYVELLAPKGLYVFAIVYSVVTCVYYNTECTTGQQLFTAKRKLAYSELSVPQFKGITPIRLCKKPSPPTGLFGKNKDPLDISPAQVV